MTRYVKAAVMVNILFFFIVSSGWTDPLRMLVWEGYAPSKQVEIFKRLVKDKYGITIDVQVSNVSAVEDFYAALKKKTADIISPAHNLPKDPRFKFIKGKLTVPINLDNVPNYKSIIPVLQNAEYILDEKEVYGVPLTYGPYGLAYNTEIFTEEPKSWNVFWTPEYAGKYTISSDYYEANIYTTALAMGLDKDRLADYNAVNTPQFIEKLRYLVQNAKSMWVGVDTADGLQGLSLATAWGFALPELKKRGEIWKMALPKEGTTGWVDNLMLGASLRNNPQMKKIAEEWLNFSLSPEFQVDVVVRSIGCYPVNTSIQGRLTPEEIKTFHVDDPNYFQDNLILWDTLNSRVRKGFQLLWNQATKK